MLRMSALQISLFDWLGRLPTGLTQLVVSPLHYPGADFRGDNCTNLFSVHLPQLRSLCHLAFHGLHEIGDTFLPDVCAAVAKAMPQLVSLHLVRMPSWLFLHHCDRCD
jgi:hypothetical protein